MKKSGGFFLFCFVFWLKSSIKGTDPIIGAVPSCSLLILIPSQKSRLFCHSVTKSCLTLLFFATLHSDVYIFPFLLCFSLLFFSQLFVRPPQTAILLLGFNMMVWKDTLSGVEWTYCCMIVTILIVVIMIS